MPRQANAKCNSLSVRRQPNIARVFVRGVGFYDAIPNLRIFGVSTNHNKYKMKKALIFGVSGQDGAYLAKLLLSKGYTVYGTSRDAQVSSFRNLEYLEYLGIHQQVQLESAALNDFRSVLQVLKKTRAKVRCTIWRVRHRWGCRLSNQ
jgi:GDP-mannose 4,6 dehydratase